MDYAVKDQLDQMARENRQLGRIQGMLIAIATYAALALLAQVMQH